MQRFFVPGKLHIPILPALEEAKDIIPSSKSMPVTYTSFLAISRVSFPVQYQSYCFYKRKSSINLVRTLLVHQRTQDPYQSIKSLIPDTKN